MSDQGDIVELLVAILQPCVARHRGADHDAVPAAHLDRSNVIHQQFLVAQRLDDRVKIREREWRARDLKHVAAEPRDLLLDIDIRALHDGHYGDEGGHPHGEPDERQYGPELVRTQGVEALRDVVPEREHSLTLKSFPFPTGAQRVRGTGLNIKRQAGETLAINGEGSGLHESFRFAAGRR